jgi:uncharacterized membrane protein YbaN (DUF454 family)
MYSAFILTLGSITINGLSALKINLFLLTKLRTLLRLTEKFRQWLFQARRPSFLSKLWLPNGAVLRFDIVRLNEAVQGISLFVTWHNLLWSSHGKIDLPTDIVYITSHTSTSISRDYLYSLGFPYENIYGVNISSDVWSQWFQPAIGNSWEISVEVL